MLAVLIAFLCAANIPEPENYNLLPIVKNIKFGASTFHVKNAAVSMPEWENNWCEVLENSGIDISPTADFKVTGTIVNEIEGTPDGNNEVYNLIVSPQGIEVKATSKHGLYQALQTFRQLAAYEKGNLPECEILDWSAFPWRGFMMDCGRSYISLDELKREIDIMSQFKLNIFHWHLTDNQAWRLESRKSPMLNDSVTMERQPGKFYTIEEVKELIDYAKARNVTIVPEIDMPGHSAAFVRATGYDMQSQEGMEILKELIDEVCEIFADVPYLHIGTDEVKFTNPDFVPEMVRYIREHGKKVISWAPGWNYKEGEIDLTHMWSYRGKPTPGVGAVDLRFHYINHYDIYADIIALYRSNVYGHKSAGDGIEGVEIALWNDRYVDEETSLIAQNSVYPTMLALAERSWHGGGEEYFDALGTNLSESDTEDFEAFKDFEKRFLHHKETTLQEVTIPYVRQTDIHWLITDAFPNNGDLSTVFPPETEGLKESYVYNDSVYHTRPATGAGIYLRHVWGNSIPGFYPAPQPNHTAYAYTWVYAPTDMTVGLQAETQNYSRSESDIPPTSGEWDYRKSRFWVNDDEIAAPLWTATHRERSNEISLGNENFAARKPIPVELKKGWNKVLIKLPVGDFRTQETRLVKWMFTFAFTTPDGKHAAPGLIYSPHRLKD